MDKLTLAKRLKALADSTEFEGERKTALQKLTAIMDANCINESDLDADLLNIYQFSYRDNMQLRLLCQIAYKVIGGNDITAYNYYETNGRKKGRLIGIECTVRDKIEIEFLFDFYKKLYDRELALFYKAFINKHNLYSPTAEIVNSLDHSELMRMASYVDGMESAIPHKAIEREKLN